MGFVFMPPTIVGGTVLVISDIRSQNYIANVSGWAIFADGSAEFFNVLIRGDLITGSPPGRRLEILQTPGNRIDFYSGDADETAPGFLQVDALASAFLELSAPETTAVVTTLARILISNDLAVDSSFAIIQATTIRLAAGLGTADLIEDPGQSGSVVASNGAFWQAPTFAGNWAVQGGSTVGYSKDFAGNVHLRGRATEPVAASTTIFTLPAGFRPSQSMTWAVKANNDAATVGWLQVTSGGAVQCIGNVVQLRVQTILDAVIFPTY